MKSGLLARRVLLALACASLPLLISASASAQYSGTVESDWRQGTRRRESAQNWAFELRFGPYYPKVDEEFKNGQQPLKQVFGDTWHFFMGVELDWQALRLGNIGSFGPGFGWGYTRMSAPAKLTGTNDNSAETTSLWIMPMYVAGVFRLDLLHKEASIPLVPYAKLGLGYAWWRASNELGGSSYDGIPGKGHSYGLHAAGGLALQLDFLDRGASQQLDNSVGINHSYVYFEWLYSDLGGFGGKQMHVGTSSWVTGLAFEI
ncbi:MAG: hypothetical protein HY898_21960 [Deltaproteobacteria bacterium]|nr:hypothetical protein [Deltaproteobacteria bacterium]